MIDLPDRLWADVCLHPTRLTGDELAYADTFPHPMHELQPVARCHRPVDHDGLHCDIVVDPDLDRTTMEFVAPGLWLEWDRDIRRWRRGYRCDADSPGDPVKSVPCTLVADHAPEGHSFEFSPDLQWPFREETR
jgi:hypothetical protein